MNDNARTLFELLPAIHRIRDAELAKSHGLARGPLEELMAVLTEQIAIAEESLDQCYDDLFIETCADWVVPYLGDLLGVTMLHTRITSYNVCYTKLLRAFMPGENPGDPPTPLTDPLPDADTGAIHPITEIQWHADDALPFALCLSAETDRNNFV